MPENANAKPVESFEFAMFAEHYQFYIHDAQTDPGEMSVYWDDESRQAMILIEQSLIGIGTVRNLDVPVVVEVYPEEPFADLDAWDQVIECSINLPSGKLMVSGATEDFYESQTIALVPGVYNVRVAYGELDAVDEEGFEGDDFYAIAVWPAVTPKESRVLKEWENRPRYMY